MRPGKQPGCRRKQRPSLEQLIKPGEVLTQEPLPNSKAFSSPPHCISGCVVVRHQLAICAAQLKAGLRLDGRAVTTGDAAVYNLPFQLGFGEIAIQGH